MGVAPRSQDHGDDTHDRPPFNWLVPIALLFFAVAYIVAFGFRAGEVRPYAKDILFALGTACLVGWLSVRLLEVPRIRNHIAGPVADLIFGERYLSMNKDSLPGLRRRIDRVYYGHEAVESPWSFYNFVSNQLDELYTSSYRRNYTLEIDCKRLPHGRMSWREKTTYLYVRNKDDHAPAVVPLYHEISGVQDVDGKSKEDQKHLFNARVTNLEFRVDDLHYKSAENDRTRLIADNGLRPDIDVGWDVKANLVVYNCIYAIPIEMQEPGKEVLVEIREEWVGDSKDDIYYAGVAKPTEDFTLVCNFPEDVRLELMKFVRYPPQESVAVTALGHGMIAIRGWLMPGLGGAVVWFGLREANGQRAPAVSPG